MNEEELNWPVTVTLFDYEQYDGPWMPENLGEAVDWLRGFLDRVPEEYRDTAKIEISSVGSWEDSHYATIEISYRRPPTDDERWERGERERQRIKAMTSRERAEYKRLKAKYGDRR